VELLVKENLNESNLSLIDSRINPSLERKQTMNCYPYNFQQINHF